MTTPAAPAKLRVLTINIWNRQGPWEARARLLRAGIEALDPDVIGMQEVLSDGTTSLTDDIAGGLGLHTVFGVAKHMPGGIEFGNAALSRWPIAEHEVVPLPAAGTGACRSVLATRIDTPHGPLPFLVTHLSWRFNHGFAREQQVLALADVMTSRFPTGGKALPLVMVGDFNATADATEIRFLRGLHALEGRSVYLGDCFELAGQGPGITFDTHVNPNTAHRHDPPRRIDYVFVRGPDTRGRGRALHARVVLDEVVDGVAASDHYGVYAELSL